MPVAGRKSTGRFSGGCIQIRLQPNYSKCTQLLEKQETTQSMQQSNQRVMLSKTISSPLSAFASGSTFDVMDKTGYNDLT